MARQSCLRQYITKVENKICDDEKLKSGYIEMIELDTLATQWPNSGYHRQQRLLNVGDSFARLVDQGIINLHCLGVIQVEHLSQHNNHLVWQRPIKHGKKLLQSNFNRLEVILQEPKLPTQVLLRMLHRRHRSIFGEACTMTYRRHVKDSALASALLLNCCQCFQWTGDVLYDRLHSVGEESSNTYWYWFLQGRTTTVGKVSKFGDARILSIQTYKEGSQCLSLCVDGW